MADDQTPIPVTMVSPISSSPSPLNINTPNLQPQAGDPQTSFASQVRGPFGSKGVLGNVLGVLGDIVLANAGLQPQYLPKLQRAHQADAIGSTDFASDPQGSLSRLAAQVGAPQAQQIMDEQSLNAQRQQQIKLAQQQLPYQIADQKQKVLNFARSMIGASNQQSYPAVYNQVSRMLANVGSSPDEIGAPQAFDANVIKSIVRGGMTGAEQQTADYHNTRLDQIDAAQKETQQHNRTTEGIGQQNADSTAKNVDSEVEYRPVTAGAAASNAATNAQRADDYHANTQSEIDNRAWNQQHPSKSRRLNLPGASAPPPEAVQMLKANPSLAPYFDQKYGAGAAKKAVQ